MEQRQVDANDLMDQVKAYRKKAPEPYWASFGAMASNLPEAHHSTTWIGEKGLESLRQWDGDNQLLMVSFIKPHHPFDPPAPWSEMYDPASLSLLPGWTEQCLELDLRYHKGYFPHHQLTETSLKQVMALYYGAISQIDHYVGKMTDLLKEKGMYDDTLILYTSDHGEYMGYHHLLLKHNYMYEPLVKVPLIVKFPGNRNGGTTRSDLVSNIDIAPTLLKQAGCTGDSFLGKDMSKETGREFIFAEHSRGSQYMLRSANRKLILHKKKEMSLFFDLEEDPLELHNLFFNNDYQQEIRLMLEKLSSTVLFETVSPSHLDADAAVIAPARNAKKDPAVVFKWFDEQMSS
jgi:arylsulfatase A-like enzyme